MAQTQGTIQKPLDEASTVLRRVAGEQGWAIAEAESTPNLLTFKKGASLFSWGSQLYVTLTGETPEATRLHINTSETFSLADWGRGKRSAIKLLEGAGATII